jgi:hypothetical protein
MGRLVHILHIETKGGIFFIISIPDKILYNILGAVQLQHIRSLQLKKRER